MRSRTSGESAGCTHSKPTPNARLYATAARAPAWFPLPALATLTARSERGLGGHVSRREPVRAPLLSDHFPERRIGPKLLPNHASVAGSEPRSNSGAYFGDRAE